MKAFAQRGLHARILLLVALTTAAPALLLGFLAVRRARHDVRLEVVRGNLALVRALGAALDGTLQDARRALGVAAGAWADGVGADPGATARLISRLRRELPLTRAVAILDAEGRPVAGDPLAAGDLERANTYGGYVSDVHRSPRDGSPCAFIVAQARTRTGELAGFLAAEVDLSFIATTLASARLGPGTRLWVVDASGEPVGWSGGAAAGPAPEPAVVERALGSADEGSLEAAGVLAVYQNLSSFQTERGVNWAIILAQPTSQAYVLAARTTRDITIGAVAVLLVALLLAGVVAERLARPLVQLAAAVDAVAEDAPEADRPPLPRDAPGEIGALARRFDEMARRVGERDRLKTALVRGERLATVGVLAAGVAHEINNPLTSILGYAGLLLEEKPEGHPDHAALALISDEARRVQGIVRTLLDHARADAGPTRLEPVDVNALVERTALLVGPMLKKRRGRLVLELGADLPRPEGRPGSLEQVFLNLAQNAVQAIDGGGRVTIRTRASADGQVAVDFSDDGPGVAAEIRAQIFEPFFTTKGAGEGTGLGLAIARQIVDDHAGRIEVTSEPDRGATFSVILGAGAGPPPDARRPPTVPDPQRRSEKR